MNIFATRKPFLCRHRTVLRNREVPRLRPKVRHFDLPGYALGSPLVKDDLWPKFRDVRIESTWSSIGQSTRLIVAHGSSLSSSAVRCERRSSSTRAFIPRDYGVTRKRKLFGLAEPERPLIPYLPSCPPLAMFRSIFCCCSRTESSKEAR